MIKILKVFRNFHRLPNLARFFNFTKPLIIKDVYFFENSYYFGGEISAISFKYSKIFLEFLRAFRNYEKIS